MSFGVVGFELGGEGLDGFVIFWGFERYTLIQLLLRLSALPACPVGRLLVVRASAPVG